MEFVYSLDILWLFQQTFDSQTAFDILSLGVGGVVGYHVLKTIFKSSPTFLYISALLFVPVVFYVIYLNLLKDSYSGVPYAYIGGAAVVSLVFYFLLSDANEQVQKGKGGMHKTIINLCGLFSLLLIFTNIYPVADFDLAGVLETFGTNLVNLIRSLGSSG